MKNLRQNIKHNKMNLDLSKILGVEVDNVNGSDCPDFVDAFISYAEYKENGQWRELTEAELDWLNEKHPDFVYESVWESIHECLRFANTKGVKILSGQRKQ